MSLAALRVLLAACLTVAAVAATVVAESGWKADGWQYDMSAVETLGYSSCTPVDYEPGVSIAYCYQADDTRPDYVGIAVRARVDTLDTDWRDWVAPEVASHGAEPAMNLIASLHPIAVWLQVFRVTESRCVRSLGKSEDCGWPLAASPFSAVVASRYYKSVGWQTEGWRLANWQAQGSLVTMEFADGLLFLFAPGTRDLRVSYALSIWDDGLDSWNDGGSRGDWDITLHCWEPERR